MSTPDMQLISRIVREGKEALNTVFRWGITEEDFSIEEAKGYWSHIVGFHRSGAFKGSVPGLNTMTQQFPTFVPCDDASMSTEALCQLLRDKRLISQIKITAQQAIETAEIDPSQAAAVMQKAMSKVLELGTSKKTDIRFESAFEEIIHEYNLGEAGFSPARALWPWRQMNEVTGGIQPDDYIVLYGRPKSMKTWVLCKIIAELFSLDKKVLIYTKEMTPKNLYKRIASILAEVPYSDLRRIRLCPEDRLKFFQAYEYVKSKSNLLCCLSGQDVPQGGDTVAWFRAKAELYKPDVAAIDGMYLMSSTTGAKQADWVRVSSISREISQMRLDLQLPVLATVQANRKAAAHSKAELDEIAYSDAISQDATVAMRVINEKTTPTIALVMGGSREFELPGIRIGGVPSVDFFEKEVLTEKDIHKAKERDTLEEESPASHARKRKTSRTEKETLMNQQLEQHMRNV